MYKKSHVIGVCVVQIHARVLLFLVVGEQTKPPFVCLLVYTIIFLVKKEQ